MSKKYCGYNHVLKLYSFMTYHKIFILGKLTDKDD